jgi:putative FmdB family regulatory protein
VPLYEYRCRSCGERFDLRRPVAEADATATCPAGHPDGTRLLAAFAATGRATAAGPVGDAAMPAGPCSNSCACYPD